MDEDLFAAGKPCLGCDQEFFSKDTSNRVIAVGDYVWAHVNFLNLFNDDPQDTGIAGVDIYKMDADGKAIEHWDMLQFVGDPQNSAPLLGPTITRANANGMFEERT